MTVDQAVAEMRAAGDEFRGAVRARTEAVNAAHEATAGALNAAKTRLSLAEEAHRLAVVAATSDHPMTGRRVFQMKKVYAQFGSRVIREDRIEGEVVTYRPGDAKPKWGIVNAGDALVLPVLKTGKLGKKPMVYQGIGCSEPEWFPA